MGFVIPVSLELIQLHARPGLRPDMNDSLSVSILFVAVKKGYPTRA